MAAWALSTRHALVTVRKSKVVLDYFEAPAWLAPLAQKCAKCVVDLLNLALRIC